MNLGFARIKNLFLKRLKNNYYLYDHDLYKNHKISFSQEGEDIVLERYFDGINSGFYVDVGAHHPHRFSNTYKFYLKGWKGINIDATPGSMLSFNDLRPNDINLEVGISNDNKAYKYFVFSEPALNTMSEFTANQYIDKGWPLEKCIQLQTKTLESVLDQYLTHGQQIDFMNIDVEGFDYKVLASNCWEKYKPKFILVELLNCVSLEEANETKESKFLINLGYCLVAKTYNTAFFKYI